MALVEAQGVGRRAARLGWGVALAAILVTGAGVMTGIPQTGRDPMYGLLASEQILQGRDATLTDMLVADSADLTRDIRQRISWWPPGQQQVVYGLRRLGLPLGTALRVFVASAWVLGLIGWSLWFRGAFSRQPALWPWLIAAFALFRMTHLGAFMHLGGDTIVWGVFPWIALLNLAALRATGDRPGRVALAAAAAAGALGTWLIVAKFTVVFLAAGIGAAWLWSWRTRDAPASLVISWITGSIAGVAAAWFTGLGLTLAGTTPADSWCVHPAATIAAWAVGGPVLGLSDAVGLLNFLLGGDVESSTLDPWVAVVASISALLVIGWLTAARAELRVVAADTSHAQRLAVRIGIACCVVTTIGLAVLMARRGCISWEGRHQQYGAFLILPFGVAFASHVWSLARASAAARALTMLVAAATIGIATAYGTAAFAKKMAVDRAPAASVAASNGIRLFFASTHGGAAFEREFRAIPGIDQAVIYTALANLPLAFPELRYTRYGVHDQDRGRPAGGIVAINLPEYAQDGVDLRRVFPDVPSWTKVTLASAPQLDVWIGR